MSLKHANDPWIYTYTGKRFHLLRSCPSEINIKDIAWSLARQSRFYGHTKGEPYSTAQHCVLCARNAPAGFAWPLLMHDAAEGYLGDVSAKLKWCLPDYLRIEKQKETAVMKHFRVPYPFAPEVHMVDKILCATEMRDLQRRRDWRDMPFKPLKEKITPWPWKRAYREFLDEFERLRPR